MNAFHQFCYWWKNKHSVMFFIDKSTGQMSHVRMHRIIQLSWLLLELSCLTTASTEHYSFSECGLSNSTVFTILGISVRSQQNSFYTEENVQCTVMFQPADSRAHFFLRLVKLDLPPPLQQQCKDYVSVSESLNLSQPTHTLWGNLCGDLADVSKTSLYSRPGAVVHITWSTGPLAINYYHGFHIILTAVLPSTVCSGNMYYQCASNNACISQSLVCDGTPNCLLASDEDDCHVAPPEAPTHTDGMEASTKTLPHVTHVITTHTTREPLLSSSTSPDKTGSVFEDVDMVSIIVVGVLFVVILMICIILACRSKGGSHLDALNAEESNRLRLEIHPDSGSDIGPITPPPRYSLLERQSQISVPPDYEEAVRMMSQGSGFPRRTSSRTSSRQPSFTRNGCTPVGQETANSHGIQGQYRNSLSSNDAARPRYCSQMSGVSEVIDENTALGEVGTDVFLSGGDDSPDKSQVPVTSTPFSVTHSRYEVTNIDEDSRAPLFRLEEACESSPEAIRFDDRNKTNSQDDCQGAVGTTVLEMQGSVINCDLLSEAGSQAVHQSALDIPPSLAS